MSDAQTNPNMPSDVKASLPTTTASTAPTATPLINKRASVLDRAFSKPNRKAAVHFFSAYAQTWVGLSPIWLMGEALTPGTKVGTQFKKGTKKLMSAAQEIQLAVKTSSKDIVVIVDQKLQESKSDTAKTAEVLKAAGANAILVVSRSLEQAQAQLQQQDLGPKIQKVIKSNGRDVVVILDKALKHPVVITGVTTFAKSRGIPHADALLRLGSLALNKILAAMPEDVQEAFVEELDASELERTSSIDHNAAAAQVGKHGQGERPPMGNGSGGGRSVQPSSSATVGGGTDADPYAKMKAENSCVVM